MIDYEIVSKFHINTILAYIFLTCVYSIFFIKNLNQKSYWVLMGSALILTGYALLTFEYYNEYNIIKKNQSNLLLENKHLTSEELQHDYQELELNLIKEEYFTGHLVLFLFHFLSTILPINKHRKKSDITAIIGHLLIYTNTFLPFGYISLIIYYSLYAVRNFADIERFFVNILQVVAALMIVYHYSENLLFMSKIPTDEQ